MSREVFVKFMATEDSNECILAQFEIDVEKRVGMLELTKAELTAAQLGGEVIVGGYFMIVCDGVIYTHGGGDRWREETHRVISIEADNLTLDGRLTKRKKKKNKKKK